ncbi:MAG: tetratricopeptide repeat protein, partial [Polyangiaceae bacterium]|nr:tetratricopeptide repeat protein [Polyangiaceae bacterium]
RIDAFRLAGDLASARGLVPKLGAAASEPESAYVLAALDMSESRPNWAAVIDRLTVAVQGEGDLGRARGALVYALAQSGQLDAARAALAPLASRAHPHPLLAELKAHVAGIAPDAVGHAAGEASGVLDPLALPVAAAKTGDAPTPSDLAGGKRPIPGSHQELLKRAHEARNAGHLSRAERLYRTVLMRHSGDAEALTGLGDIARELGDKSASIDHYEQAARQSPSYFPALMGLADARWESGDRAGAATLYERVVQSTGGQGTYGQRARQRIAEATAESKPRPDTASAPRHTSTSQAPPAPTVAGSDGAVPPPGVDTSDLPGWSP